MDIRVTLLLHPKKTQIKRQFYPSSCPEVQIKPAPLETEVDETPEEHVLEGTVQ